MATGPFSLHVLVKHRLDDVGRVLRLHEPLLRGSAQRYHRDCVHRRKNTVYAERARRPQHPKKSNGGPRLRGTAGRIQRPQKAWMAVCTGTRLAPCHICTGGTGLAPCHICTGTGITPATSVAGLGSLPATSEGHAARRQLASVKSNRRCSVQRATQHATNSMQPSDVTPGTRSINHTIQDAICSMQHAAYQGSMRHAACNTRHAPCKTQHAKPIMQHAACSMQHTKAVCKTCSMQHATCSMQKCSIPRHYARHDGRTSGAVAAGAARLFFLAPINRRNWRERGKPSAAPDGVQLEQEYRFWCARAPVKKPTFEALK